MRVNIDIALTHQGVRLEGKVVSLHRGEIQVTMTAPYRGISASRHTFYKKDGDQPFAREDQGDRMTVAGKKAAGSILVDIYEKTRFFEKHRSNLESLYQPVKSRLQEAYSRLRDSHVLGGADASSSGPQNHARQQQTLQDIFWLQHEFYKNALEHYPDLEGIGVDTFMDLVQIFLDKTENQNRSSS